MKTGLTREQELRLSSVVQNGIRKLRKRLGAAIDDNAVPEVVIEAAKARRWSVLKIEAARNELVDACIPWVSNLVSRKTPRGCLTYDDLKQAGAMGLMKAALRYKGDRAKWSTYATCWIRQSIMRCERSESNMIRVPEWMYNLLNTDRLDVAETERIRKLMIKGSDYLEPGTIMEDPLTFDYIDRELRRLLTVRQRFVILSRFGLGDCRYQTLKELGNTLSLSRERVRQIQNEAIKKLQQSDILKEEHEH